MSHMKRAVAVLGSHCDLTCCASTSLVAASTQLRAVSMGLVPNMTESTGRDVLKVDPAGTFACSQQ